jgi:hypothetical protein
MRNERRVIGKEPGSGLGIGWEAGANVGFGERDFEGLVAGGGAADQDDIAGWDTERLCQEPGDGGVGSAIGRGRGNPDLQAALVVEASDGIARGPGCDADVECGHGEKGLGMSRYELPRSTALTEFEKGRRSLSNMPNGKHTSRIVAYFADEQVRRRRS